MLFGFIPIGTTTFGFPVQVTNSSRTPSTPAAAPTWRIYGPAGGAALLTGTFPATDTDSQLGWRFSGNVAITVANGFAAGSTYFIRVDYTVSGTEEVDVGAFAVV